MTLIRIAGTIAIGTPLWVMANWLWWRACADWLIAYGMPEQIATGIFIVVGTIVVTMTPLTIFVYWDHLPLSLRVKLWP